MKNAKKYLYMMLGIVCLIFILSCAKKQREDVLTVYVPDSFSWLKKSGISEKFEEKFKCEINFVYFEAAVNIVSRLELEKSNPKADVAMGLSRSTLLKAKNSGILQKYKPENAVKIMNGNEISPDFYATAFDYGGLAIIYDSKKLNKKLTTFEDLTKLKRKLVFPDPRTSTTGQDFLLWTIAVYKDKWQDYWKRLRPAILTVTNGWSSAYAKLQTGEAYAMVSYASDNAYNLYKYKKSKFDVLVPSVGGFKQLEGSSLISKEKIKPEAKEFINFLLSDEVQSKIFQNNWMMPVTNVKLPDIAKYYVKADKYLNIPNSEIEKNLPGWLRDWAGIVTKK